MFASGIDDDFPVSQLPGKSDRLVFVRRVINNLFDHLDNDKLLRTHFRSNLDKMEDSTCLP